MNSHLLLRHVVKLNTPKPSYVMWSIEPATTVIFFVHGFMGSAMSTWREFDSLAPYDPTYEKMDLVFLGYNSVKEQTNISADRILMSCHNLIQDPSGCINSTVDFDRFKRSKEHQYQKVVFVAHSLGAIITRQLLLVAEQRNYPWLDNVRMVLFAPAHNGATDVSKLPGSIANLLGPLSPVFSNFISWKAQTLSEIKENSATLKSLEKRTNVSLLTRRQKSLSLRHLIADKVIFGASEDVVQTPPFCEDPPLDVVPNKGHQDICKPTSNFLDPVSFLH
ncbi:MAG: hypothetical protein HY938_09415 [Nitrosomonadales bacterium]|nr:hypothetical protein [Nitrosomonadales bacterium]